MATKTGGLADLVVKPVLPNTEPGRQQDPAGGSETEALEPSKGSRQKKATVRGQANRQARAHTKRQRSFQLPEEIRAELRERARRSSKDTVERILLQAIRNNFNELAAELKQERANEDSTDAMFQGLGESEADEPGLHQNAWLFDTDHATIEDQADRLGFRNKSHLAATALRLEFETPAPRK